MKNDKLIELLFSTRNINKILTEYNKLSFNDKQIFLTNDKVKKRISKIADVSLLFYLLIDLPYEFRLDFLDNIDVKKFSHDYEIATIDFLKLSNYNLFQNERLICFHNLKDKKLLSIMFRFFSLDKLRMIISNNYNQFTTDFAFTQYSKKNMALDLDAKLINNVSDNVFFGELKRRLANLKLSTSIDINEFLLTTLSKQNYLFTNGNFEKLENDLLLYYHKNCTDKNTELLIQRCLEILENINCVHLLELQTIISHLDDEVAIEIMREFFKKCCNFEYEVEEKYLRSMIYNFRKLNDKTKELYKTMKLKPFALINYLNTGFMDDEVDSILDENITITQYQKTNIKKVNKIMRYLEQLKDEKTSDLDISVLSYKLYYIFGYETAFELLSGKFGNINFKLLNDLLDKCNVCNVNFQEVSNGYEPSINMDLMSFLIGNKKDNNSTIKRMLRGELSLLVDEFHNVYNNFDKFQKNLGKKIHLNQLIPMLEENPFILSPHEYKLTRDILNIIIKSYGDINKENNDFYSDESKECVLEACNFYHKYLEKRVVSSIPRVSGYNENNYKYEVLRLDDPLIMTLGYKTGCCFRLNGGSKEFLRYCSESLYARVVVIRDEKDEICAMVPIIRNGNVIVGNSIESSAKAVNSSLIYNTLKSAFDDILEISNKYEENPIVACCVTDLHSNVSNYSKQPIKNNIFPISDESFYTNYDSPTYIVSILEDKMEDDFQLYAPTAIYADERPDILVYRWDMKDQNTKREVEKRIKSVAYQLNSSEGSLYYSDYIICSEDWYLMVDYNEIKGYYLEKDPRAFEEFKAVKKYLEEKIEGKRLYQISISDDDFNDNSSCPKSKKLVLKNKCNIEE